MGLTYCGLCLCRVAPLRLASCSKGATTNYAQQQLQLQLRTTPNNTAVAVTFLPLPPLLSASGMSSQKAQSLRISHKKVPAVALFAHMNEQHCSTQTTSVFLVSASGNSSQRSQSLRSGQIREVALLKRSNSAQEEHRCSTSHIPTSAGTLSHLHCGKWVNFTPFNKFLVTLF